ncbi:carboxylating nicotinate-nucleotide diphosphorylase [Corynebacterium lubricantis]|uniref:carboxylating nicotinate-nucleotide diphosphorylase n=1 Tax=Corynebacterium lubricantis TaxID=541095 RepID=UPI00035EBC57|nr:carboxylating nicotinate-nucleotide diphosphorylase [Corynebacterium lubricantis]
MIDHRTIERLVGSALSEDAPWGDITTEALVPADAQARAELSARELGTFSGVQLLTTTFALVDPTVTVELHIADGEAFDKGQSLATIEGSARSILRAERIALNFVQRMSGIATQTARYVAAANGTRIADTRKTTPGLRLLERQAVRDGGGHNHRSSLSDAILVKDNHLAAVGADITTALRAMRERVPHTTHIEVEVDRMDQIEPVLAAGVDTIMLDNFSIEELREGVALVNGRALVDASGGITLETIPEVAATGVDLISVGALTHSVRALDLGLDFH